MENKKYEKEKLIGQTVGAKMYKQHVSPTIKYKMHYIYISKYFVYYKNKLLLYFKLFDSLEKGWGSFFGELETPSFNVV
jgi:hypothetical protein